MPRNSDILNVLAPEVREKLAQTSNQESAKHLRSERDWGHEFSRGLPTWPLRLLPRGERVPDELHLRGARRDEGPAVRI